MPKVDHPLVEVFAAMGVAAPLLEQHSNVDGRCAVCHSGSIQTVRVIWPCTIHSLASAALALDSAVDQP